MTFLHNCALQTISTLLINCQLKLDIFFGFQIEFSILCLLQPKPFFLLFSSNTRLLTAG